MSPLAPLTDRNLGWLRYLHRTAPTSDDWDREGHPHAHWDNVSDAPMLCYHRFDLIDSTYAVALMADRTPAWREVYERILDELIISGVYAPHLHIRAKVEGQSAHDRAGMDL